MAAINLLKPTEYIPAAAYSSTVAGEFRVIPKAGQAWRATHNLSNGTSVFRGRIAAKNGSFTNMVVRVASGKGDGTLAGAFGGTDEGLEATILTLTTADTIVSANTFAMPNVQLLLSGTAGASDTHARIWLQFGLPLAKFVCVSAIAGMPWTVGQDLLDPRLGRVDWQ